MPSDIWSAGQPSSPSTSIPPASVRGAVSLQREPEPPADARRPSVGADDEPGGHGRDQVVELVAQRRRRAGHDLDVPDPAQHGRARLGGGAGQCLARLGMADVQGPGNAGEQAVQRDGVRLGGRRVDHLVVRHGPRRRSARPRRGAASPGPARASPPRPSRRAPPRAPCRGSSSGAPAGAPRSRRGPARWRAPRRRSRPPRSRRPRSRRHVRPREPPRPRRRRARSRPGSPPRTVPRSRGRAHRG